ncbi:hypothetical protein G7046_g3159 [Stylonectria norvegica]|nr:hypothetical protein G7046_g3159 [Stylonectria norvegica]
MADSPSAPSSQDKSTTASSGFLPHVAPRQPPTAPSRAPTTGIVHKGWEALGIGMAKCDFCNRRARGTVQKCLDCQLSVCHGCCVEGCLEGNNRHVLDPDTVSWDVHVKMKARRKKDAEKASEKKRAAAPRRGRVTRAAAKREERRRGTTEATRQVAASPDDDDDDDDEDDTPTPTVINLEPDDPDGDYQPEEDPEEEGPNGQDEVGVHDPSRLSPSGERPPLSQPDCPDQPKNRALYTVEPAINGASQQWYRHDGTVAQAGPYNSSPREVLPLEQPRSQPQHPHPPQHPRPQHQAVHPPPTSTSTPQARRLPPLPARAPHASPFPPPRPQSSAQSLHTHIYHSTQPPNLPPLSLSHSPPPSTHFAPMHSSSPAQTLQAVSDELIRDTLLTKNEYPDLPAGDCLQRELSRAWSRGPLRTLRTYGYHEEALATMIAASCQAACRLQLPVQNAAREWVCEKQREELAARERNKA